MNDRTAAGWLNIDANIRGYGQMVTERVLLGWEGYILTFHFSQLNGSQKSIHGRMESEIQRVYATMLTRLVRNPRAESQVGSLPMWLVTPDLPVPKWRKQPLGVVSINDGLHYHGVGLNPPWTRLREEFSCHVERCQGLYVQDRRTLQRIHAEPITHDPGYVVEYAFKSLQRRRFDLDRIIILPRVRSELPSAPLEHPIRLQ
jgi:hypothetical protein